uniref:Pro-thyrotropin-releasing hormone n=1 Tax=Sphenodon punctatus TaxID=8508 RepID=A0A8D0HNG7_SPHPU
MTSARLPLLLLSLILTGVCVNLGQPIPDASEGDEKSHLDDILQRAESIILRSILKKAEEEEESNKEPRTPQLDWFSKRQHPGKRSLSDLEKRQHPGKREEDEPGSYAELQKRQHPGRRSMLDQYIDIPSTQLAYLNELSKRQHPGKRYLVYSKRQHPGKRGWDEELEVGEPDLEKRQHPGKRSLGSESFDYTAPCNPQDSFNCGKGSLLLELLDNVSKGWEEEKQQHPGRRSAWESEAEAEE